MAHVWKVGDVVQLKSGGPPMTVKSAMNNDFNCEWSDGVEFRSADFKGEQLQGFSAAAREVVQ